MRATLPVLLLIGMTGCQRTSDAEEQQAVAAIEKLGGSVTRNETASGKPVLVTLSFTTTKDEDLRHLKVFTQVEDISLLIKAHKCVAEANSSAAQGLDTICCHALVVRTIMLLSEVTQIPVTP